MSIYLVIVLLAVPGQGGELVAELSREWISASTASVCQSHADKRAEEARKKQQVRGRVFGVCVLRGEMA
jgi:hypothetical protein